MRASAIVVTMMLATTAASSAPFEPVDLTVDVSALPANEQRALGKMIEAARIMDALFLRQAWAGNESLLLTLLADPTPAGKTRLREFLRNKGPWDQLAHNKSIVPGAPDKPPQADFYPADATKAEVEAWMKSLPPAERARAEGFYTVIRRAPDGKLTSVPYSTAYAGELAIAGKLLEEAAALTAQPTLRAFLHARARAFAGNDYYDSDVAWMNLDASVEPTIGPYETYEDEWFGDKAAFEAFITTRDDAETKKLARFSAELQDIENHLPIDAALRNPKLGALAPIRVVNELYCSGDANHGVQTAAFNLPNDERIAKEKGTKRVMLKNVQAAKFNVVMQGIARVVLAPADRKNVAFEPFFTHILMHEVMHGLGPHNITVGGRATTPRQELQETGSAIEEAKADVSGLFALQYLIDKGAIDKAMERTLYTTYLVETFRAVRFGIGEAHGKGMALQLNTLLDAGAIIPRGGLFTVDAAKFKQAIVALTHDLLMIEAHGDAAAARALLAKMGVVRPEIQRAIDKLARVPVDIEPRFVTADKLVQKRALSYFVAGILRIILLEASAALLILTRVVRRDDGRGQRRLDLGFRVVAVLALFSWTNFGALRGGGDLVHRWEQYHFFFGSKYLPELGYFNLYKATILADRESANAIGFVRVTRDLTTFDEVPVERALENAADVRAAFSEARWSEFKRDWGLISQGSANWVSLMDDHGNSGSPAWAIFAAPIARVCGIGPGGQKIMGLIDPLLMIVLFALFFRTFGTRPTCVALVVFSMMPFCFDYLAGSLLRWDWLFALGLTLVLWQKHRPLGAGVALGYAIASKLFPLFFGVGFAFWAAWEALRTRTFDRRLLRFAAGAVTAIALSVAISSAMFGPRVWRGYKERIAVAQHEHFYANQYSFKTVFLQAAFSTPRELAADWALPPSVKAARPDVDVTAWPIAFVLLQLALTALVALGLRYADPIEAFAIGPLLVYVWLVVNAYYWNMLALTALAWSLRLERDRLAALLGLHALLVCFYIYQHLAHGFAEGYIVGVMLLALLVGWALLAMRRPQLAS